MDTRANYYLIGRTNSYQAQVGRHAGFFNGKTLRARIDPVLMYATRAEASEWIMKQAAEDHGAWPDEDTGILLQGHADQVNPGDLQYHHDGYSWELVTAGDADEKEAAAILRDGYGIKEDQEAIYANFPDMQPDMSSGTAAPKPL